jgi:ribonucleotide reductase beta subunit family protein with ferritin-like domain
MTKLQTPTRSYVCHYPEAIKFAETQETIFWTANEINVEKDKQDMLVNMTEAERHGVITTLKLFTLYEMAIGTDYWLNRVMKMFPRPEIQRMASVFGMFELNVHAPFYDKINKVLSLDTEEFYNDYINNKTLKGRMDFIDDTLSDPSSLVSLGCFSLMEGAVLYSSFAFLKHFQTKGKNKLLNVVRGINFSVRDENLHCVAGGWLYRSLRDEQLKANPSYQSTVENAAERIVEASRAIYEHECQIIDMIFEKGEIEGITPEQMKTFIRGRLNLCLNHLGIPQVFDCKNDIIADWFYDNINQVQFNDFFTGTGNQYNRNWEQGAFIW